MARAALAQLDLEKILWMPTGDPRYRQAPVAPAEHRVAMLRLALENESAWEIDTREIAPGASSRGSISARASSSSASRSISSRCRPEATAGWR